MLTRDRLLAETKSNQSGFFALGKVVYVISGVTVPKTERCDNLSIAGVMVTHETDYDHEALIVGRKSIYSDTIFDYRSVSFVDYPIFYPDDFLISYIQTNHSSTHIASGISDIQTEKTPSSMWIARSIYQLFKNIREWSFMAEAPFNCDHPMATYSKMVIDSLNPPQAILDEIDSMPDMHLAKFLKGQDNYRLIPDHNEVSESFKNWIIEITEKYPYPSFENSI